MGRLVDGRWVDDVRFTDDDGRFRRESSGFREWVQDTPQARFIPETGRYHLYVSLACPWAHRTVIARALGGLESAIGLSVVDPYMGQGGWRFSERPDCGPDPLFGASHLYEIYQQADSSYSGKVTTPVLFDRKENTIVNNESREIMRMFTTVFPRIASGARIDLLPPDLREQVDATLDAIYEPINNGVYRAGFAEDQAAYDEAVDELFKALDHWDGVLGQQRFLCGDRLTEADVALFTTLLRFDPVYHTHFKCNVRRIVDYPNLCGYLRDIYQMPGVAQTCNLEHIKEHYYRSHPRINPSGVVARGPRPSLTAPHGRDRLQHSSASAERGIPLPGAAAPPLEVSLLDGGQFRLAERNPKTFTLVIAYRGLHCAACGSYLRRFDDLADEFRERGVEILAVSMDDKTRATKAAQLWKLSKIMLGYGLSLDTAKRWGLYVSAAVDPTEPQHFCEPGLFLVRPGGVLYYAATNSMSFGRPQAEELLDAVENVAEQTIPARGSER